MIADYKGKQYKIVKDGKNWELVTKNPQSVEEGFMKDGNIFYKSINDLSMIEDMYDIWMLVEYDTHFEKVPKQWRLEFTKEFLSEGKIKLLFGEGILPGWNVEDKNVCSKYVSVSEISSAYVVKRSKISDNEKKETINISDVIDVFNRIMTL